MKIISQIKDEVYQVNGDEELIVISGTAHTGKSNKLAVKIVGGNGEGKNNRLLVALDGVDPFNQLPVIPLLVKANVLAFLENASELENITDTYDVYIDNLGKFLSQLGYHCQVKDMLNVVVELFRKYDNLHLKAVTIQTQRDLLSGYPYNGGNK